MARRPQIRWDKGRKMMMIFVVTDFSLNDSCRESGTTDLAVPILNAYVVTKHNKSL